LQQTAHRPWPLPRRPWVMAQNWQQLLFAHWPVDPGQVARLIPANLELDTFGGAAWIGIVPFRMNRVHPRGMFSVSGLSQFPELNVRTYVGRAGKPGVWFFSLDAGNKVAVRLARGLFHLPYHDAEMNIYAESGWIHYQSRRSDGQAEFVARYRPVSEVWRAQAGSLDEWLTERYCLYTVAASGQLYRGEIQHRPWPLQRAEAEIEVNTMADLIGLPDQPPVLHYAENLDVLTWYLERLS
jgi:uncharacterized protein